MSLIGWYKTRIKSGMVNALGSVKDHRNFELLRKSVEMVVEKHGGEDTRLCD